MDELERRFWLEFDPDSISIIEKANPIVVGVKRNIFNKLALNPWSNDDLINIWNK
jgi:hypothetical protein